MGSGNSTRRVVIENRDGIGLKISQDVARRITGGSTAGSENVVMQAMADPRALQELEAFYQNKLQSIEEKSLQVFQERKEQFARAVAEVEKKFLKATGSPVCQDLEHQVLQCYQDNPYQPLTCAMQVQAFSSCVTSARQNALLKTG